METLEIFAQDNRSLQQWLDDYEAQKKEVEEKALDEISTEDDYEQLDARDKLLLDNYNASKGLLVETHMALDFVKTSAVLRPDVQQGFKLLRFQTPMNGKEEYAHAVVTLTGGFDARMGKLLKTVKGNEHINHFTDFSNAPLSDKTVFGLIKDEVSKDVLNTTTVAELAGIIADTRELREEMNISDKSVINDTLAAITNDIDKLNEFDYEYVQQEEFTLIESNDGYAMNTSKQTASNAKEASEKVNANNEVVHNEAPKATTTDASKVGGNVKLEEANDKGTEDTKPTASRKNSDRDDR